MFLDMMRITNYGTMATKDQLINELYKQIEAHIFDNMHASVLYIGNKDKWGHRSWQFKKALSPETSLNSASQCGIHNKEGANKDQKGNKA
jgi:hypothetical protein